jgi:hypothetical protein
MALGGQALRLALRRPVHSAVVLAVALVVGLIGPAAASAAQRYADAGSSLTSGSCPQGAPCRIDYAINSAGSGDEVIVGPGSYDVTSLPALNPAVPLTIHGAAGGPRPLLGSASSSFLQSTLSVAAGSTVRDLALTRTVGGPAALFGGADVTVERVVASSVATAAILIPRATIRDTVALCSGASGTGVYLNVVNAGDRGVSTLRNVTAIGNGPNGAGIVVRNFVSGAGVQSATVRNVIARGTDSDFVAEADDGAATAALDIDYTNYDPAKLGTFGPGNKSFTIGTHNQDSTASPAALVNLGGGDVHQAPGSPTIDAGVDDGANGAFDYDGDPRTLGAHADIGADEFVPASASPGGSANAGVSNAFTLGKVQRNRRRGTARLTVIVPGPGTLTLTGSGVVGQAASATSGTSTTSVTGAGSVVLQLRARGKTRSRLNRTGRARIGLTVIFAPLGGTPAQQGTTIKLRKRLPR